MQLRLDPEYGTEKVLTSCVFGQDVRFVERAVGRFVSNEHVRIVRDKISVLADFHQALPCEGPVSAHRVDRRSPELQPFEGDPGILKVGGIREVSTGQLRFAVEEQIVIASDRNKPEEVREKWVEMMNGAMQKAGIEQRLDPRSWAEQGREDLVALREEKTLRGDGPEAQERHERIAEQRQMRAELPAPHLDQATAVQEMERRAEIEVAGSNRGATSRSASSTS